MFYTCNYNIRVTHGNGAIKHIFTRIRSTEGSSADRSLFILSLHALALHLWLKYYFKSFCMKIGYRWFLHTSVGCISLQNASRTALCYATNTIKWKTFLILLLNHQLKILAILGPDWNDKNDNANYAPSYHIIPPMAQVAIFKEIFDYAKRFRLWIVLF